MEKTAGVFTIIAFMFLFFSCGRQAAESRFITLYEYSGEDKEITLENDYLIFKFFPALAEFSLVDKIIGAEWRSNPTDASSDPLADPVTSALMQSLFALQYADVSGVGTVFFGMEHSVALNAWDYSESNGALELNFTVGDLERSYILPPSAPEERMLLFLDRMSRDDRRKVETSYRLYDIDRLRENDNRAALLEQYPDLARGKVYILRENTQEYMKAQIEEYFLAAGYTREDYAADYARGASASIAEKPAFNLTLRFSLDGRSLLLDVPFDKIAYRPSFPITQLSLLPYMGSGGSDDDGYLLVPDGSGALIYFNNGRHNQIAYSSYVYGWDETMPREAVVSDNKAPIPVFGINRNGNSLLCIIEEGSSYAAVRADVSGRNSSWNTVYPRFDMIHGAVMDISGRTDRNVYLYENGLPRGERIVLRYTPCGTGGYVGLAKEYRSWLLERHPDLGRGMSGGVPIAVEIVGAVNKTTHRMGIPMDRPLKLTSYKEAEAMIRDFSGLGWNNLRVKLNGWFNHSVDHSVPSGIRLISELGSRKDLRNLVAAAEECGSGLFPEADFLYIKDVRPFDGYSIYRDTARYVNRKRIEKYPYSFVWFGERVSWGKLSYISRPTVMMSMIDSFARKEAVYGLSNIAFRSMGGKLSGDYNEKRFVSREASMALRKEKFQELKNSGVRMMVDTGFIYSVPWADFITGMALEDQGFGITDVSVPFLQIALHGLVPFAGKAINLAEDYTRNLLRTVECGAGLYFSFMAEETGVLQETKFRQFYANEYSRWVGDADALYRQFSADFGGLYSQAIEGHKILSPGVTLTEYADGSIVIVNMSPSSYVYGGINGENFTVGTESYIVLRQEN